MKVHIGLTSIEVHQGRSDSDKIFVRPDCGHVEAIRVPTDISIETAICQTIAVPCITCFRIHYRREDNHE